MQTSLSLKTMPPNSLALGDYTIHTQYSISDQSVTIMADPNAFHRPTCTCIPVEMDFPQSSPLSMVNIYSEPCRYVHVGLPETIVASIEDPLLQTVIETDFFKLRHRQETKWS